MAGLCARLEIVPPKRGGTGGAAHLSLKGTRNLAGPTSRSEVIPVCRALSEGGRRCPIHTPLARAAIEGAATCVAYAADLHGFYRSCSDIWPDKETLAVAEAHVAKVEKRAAKVQEKADGAAQVAAANPDPEDDHLAKVAEHSADAAYDAREALVAAQLDATALRIEAEALRKAEIDEEFAKTHPLLADRFRRDLREGRRQFEFEEMIRLAQEDEVGRAREMDAVIDAIEDPEQREEAMEMEFARRREFDAQVDEAWDRERTRRANVAKDRARVLAEQEEARWAEIEARFAAARPVRKDEVKWGPVKTRRP
ncbi:hypothetical protein [Nocardioides sp. KR10-350]|uniref:hypothetical protein n=1 Tax=Nocardioides cheoyonin TaxID=3156615 RepID=UPI0032B3EF50